MTAGKPPEEFALSVIGPFLRPAEVILADPPAAPRTPRPGRTGEARTAVPAEGGQ
ncbi:MAG TPA: hypothetical protein VFO01_13820 [Trebonia sp.]|nr:hypothetical protein [Trebonia sp.]